MSPERLELIRQLNREYTRQTNFSEWNSLSHGHVEELLEHVDELQEKLRVYEVRRQNPVFDNASQEDTINQ